MEKTSTVQIRIEPELKASVEKVLDDLGLSMSSAISLFLKQVVLHDGLPFPVKIPNAETLAAIHEVKDLIANKHKEKGMTKKELYEDLGI
jgi:DNA-damage-inducible protein J